MGNLALCDCLRLQFFNVDKRSTSCALILSEVDTWTERGNEPKASPRAAFALAISAASKRS